MLVINSNNQQNTTNFMLWWNQYPDVNQILMRWWPSWYNPYQITNNTNVTTYSVPVVETIWSTQINYYCPRIYSQWLLQWNRERTNRIISTGWYIMPDLWFLLFTSSSSYYLNVTSWVFKYTIAVKWLKSWQIVWENIVAPIWRVSWYAQSSTYTSKWILHIEFALLHSDWTTTSIASGDLTKMSLWDSDKLTDYWSNQISAFWLHIFNYSWTWQTAQDGDILIATVSLINAPGGTTAQIYNWEASKTIPQWIIYWSAFNMNIRDPNGFRPFQVSIRE